ncbi:glia-derived nexin-like isoform X2 [Wyeomyia smithii]|uniref:glia-derived nexin-like isoform X2 n=1 Tax=Wyeomyia smithii TaxID=174621 RepID=UPI0024681608|nr:glia-derived nexin-like isoform X2 [Wyeomyia smithii]
MYKCSVLIAILAASVVTAQTPAQVQNRHIWNNYCSKPYKGNVGAIKYAFGAICTNTEPNACCDYVMQIIRNRPDTHLCPTDARYYPSPVGCDTDPPSETPRPSNFHFPEQSWPEAPTRRTDETKASSNAPNRQEEVVEIVFNYNPHDNVRVSIPVPISSTIPANGQPQQSAPVRKSQNTRPAQPQQPIPAQHLSPPAPVPHTELVEEYEEKPVVLLNTPGHQATEFALNLFRTIDRPPNGNSVISPLLPQLLLANLVDFTDPETNRQLLQAIRLYPDQLDKLTKTLQDVSRNTVNTVEFASVNFVANNLKLNNSYTENARLRNIDVLPVNFNQPNQVARTANKWVSDKTHRLINEIVSPGSLSPETRLLLANSIFFKGKWKYTFVQTEPGQFESSPGRVHKVNNMFQLNKLRYGELKLADGDGFRWLELPYEGNTLAMLIFLPLRRHQLEPSLQKLHAKNLALIMAQLQDDYIDTKVNVRLPKFTLTDSVSLNGPLQRLGLNSIFHDRNALKYLSNEPTIVSDVTQRTYLSVDEQGTKATSVASLSIVPLSITPQFRQIQFDVDQPFLAMIVDKNERYPVFIGQIYEPYE